MYSHGEREKEKEAKMSTIKEKGSSLQKAMERSECMAGTVATVSNWGVVMGYP